MKHFLRGPVLLCACLIAACASAPEVPADPAPAVAVSASDSAAAARQQQLALDASVYRVAGGDLLRIDVLGEPELSLNALVDPLGNVAYPFLGQVQAAGLTLREIEQRIYSGLRAGYLRNPDVRVSIAQYRPVYVSGQVRQAGAYPYSLGLTVEKVLTLAGGMTQFGSSRRIFLQRAGSAQDTRVRVDLDGVVYPGDTIVVEERLF